MVMRAVRGSERAIGRSIGWLEGLRGQLEDFGADQRLGKPVRGT